MIEPTSNPWAARFKPLLDPEIIRIRATLPVEPLVGLHDLPIEVAVMQLKMALTTAFYPTTQCVSVLQRLVGTAYAHCLSTYSGSAAFLAAIYSQEPLLPSFAFPICLTGLAGTGKTELAKAFLRLTGAEGSIAVDSVHSAFCLAKPWLVTIHARAEPKEVLAKLAGKTGRPADLIHEIRLRAFRDGVPLIIVDEFQFATGSREANTRVTQMLLSLAYLGIPLVFVANYSLLHRLMRRPEEDQQRLLSDPIVIVPDQWNSEDWINTLKALRDVAPGVLTFDPKKDAERLHQLTWGRKRAMKHLILIGWRLEHPRKGTVSLDTLEQASEAKQFAGFKAERDILASQATGNKPDKKRKDLWCPFPLPPEYQANVSSAAKMERDQQVAEAEAEASLTADERRAKKALEKARKTKRPRSGNVVPIGERKQKATAEDLKQNAAWLRENL
jgi:hypothetical protein